jgi:hypothetical protein
VAFAFLDESGTHDTPIITIAGHVYVNDQWKEFERRADGYLRAEKVPVFHAKEFSNRGPKTSFFGWSDAKQIRFMDEWLRIAKAHALRAITVSLPKKRYDEVRKATRKNPNISVYGQCFNGVLAEFEQEPRIWSLIQREGLSVVLELGNKHNAGVIEFFNKVRVERQWEAELKSIGECAKEDCRAIQLADFLAHYSWHYAEICFSGGGRENSAKMPPLLDLARGGPPIIGHLGGDFRVYDRRPRRDATGRAERCLAAPTSLAIVPSVGR